MLSLVKYFKKYLFYFSVPQFILDSHAQQNQYVNIIVTQPRRLAAQSVAKRVCRERGWPLVSDK